MLKKDFPFLQQQNRGKPIIYLDSASSAQKPQPVIDAISNFYSKAYANIHRGIYELSERATMAYEHVREAVKTLIHAKHADEIVYVKSATEGINLVAHSYGRSQWQAGDEILVSEMEHHSNIVPWYLLAKERGMVLKMIPVTDMGEIDMSAYLSLFSPRTKLVAITHASNVLGTINPVKAMVQRAHENGALVLVDGAQAVPHFSVDVQDINSDFYVFSAHKLYGPTGVGILCAKKELLNVMTPYQGGGGMIETVSFSNISFAKAPQKFEAGTPDIASVIGLEAAIQYVQAIGMEAIVTHEQALLDEALKKLATISGLRIVGTAASKVGVVSFVMDGLHAHDIGTVLDHEGIAVRAGHHCAMPLMARFKVPATVRVSFGIYNQSSDIDALIKALQLAKRLLS